MKIIDVKQGSPEWLLARRGIPTASNFDRIITPKTGKLSAQADDYICELIGESVGDISPESYQSADMERGIALEPEARAYYEMQYDVSILEVGFCVSDCGRWGASPDGLISLMENAADGRWTGLEIKCPASKTHCKYLFGGKLPDEYRPQVHGNLLVTGAAYWDFLSYHPEFPPLIIRVYPDDYTKALEAALIEFSGKYEAAKARMAALVGKAE